MPADIEPDASASLLTDRADGPSGWWPATMNVLMIEDNPLDARAAGRGLAAWQTAPDVVHHADGDAALAHLRDASAVRPDLVLLDLNLPGSDGHDVLRMLKNDPDLRSIPVIVMTTSEAGHDIDLSYELGANAFVTKPADLEGWREVLGQIERFWVGVAKLPGS